jgi:hypothetical protein
MNSKTENALIFKVGELEAQIYKMMLRIAVLEKRRNFFTPLEECKQ